MAATPKNSATENTTSRRDQILAASAKVFAERGIRAATVRDIGEAAGILSGSLYYHFDSKEQIVVDCLQPSLQGTHDKAVEICEKFTGLEALRELITDSIKTTKLNPHRATILKNEGRAFAEDESLAPIAEILRKIVALWFSVVEEGIELGEIDERIDTDVVVRSIFDGTQGATRWFRGARNEDPDRIVDALIGFYFDGLKKR